MIRRKSKKNIVLSSSNSINLAIGMALKSYQLSINWKVLVILLSAYTQVVSSIWGKSIKTKVSSQGKFTSWKIVPIHSQHMHAVLKEY